MKVEISVGEGIDKLSILEIKYKKIPDEEKRVEIKKEMDALQECTQYKNQFLFYYRLLMYVNEKLWDMTDSIQKMSMTDGNYAEISNDLFLFNQKRFRLKRIFNLLTSSNIKEQKNNRLKTCKIVIHDQERFYAKLPEINSLLLDYDLIYVNVESTFLSTIQSIFTIPIFQYNCASRNASEAGVSVSYSEGRRRSPEEYEDIDESTCTLIDLESFSIQDPIFDFVPITYVSGGMFGDFILQLSVINEHFYQSGRKGILYISDHIGDKFQNGALHTYNDTYEIIRSQKYIADYKVYTNETYDINLCDWRKSNQIYAQGWDKIYGKIFHVEWGKHKWIHAETDEQYQNKVLINTSTKFNRFGDNGDYQKLYHEYQDDLIYVGFEESQYADFVQRTHLTIPFHKMENFSKMCIAIHSCKLFVGSLSAPLTIAHATFVPHIVMHNHGCIDAVHVTKLLENWSHMKCGYS
jgi:hypothetical protein